MERVLRKQRKHGMGEGSVAMQTCYAFGKWLRNCRSELGISLRELGRIAGANYSYIARLEHGAHAAPSRGMVIRLAQALGASRIEALLAAGYAPYLEESGTPGQGLAGLVGERCGKLQKDHGGECAIGGSRRRPRDPGRGIDRRRYRPGPVRSLHLTLNQ